MFRDFCIGFWEVLCVLVFWEVEILGGLRNGVKVWGGGGGGGVLDVGLASACCRTLPRLALLGSLSKGRERPPEIARVEES